MRRGEGRGRREGVEGGGPCTDTRYRVGMSECCWLLGQVEIVHLDCAIFLTLIESSCY